MSSNWLVKACTGVLVVFANGVAKICRCALHVLQPRRKRISHRLQSAPGCSHWQRPTDRKATPTRAHDPLALQPSFSTSLSKICPKEALKPGEFQKAKVLDSASVPLMLAARGSDMVCVNGWPCRRGTPFTSETSARVLETQ